MKISAETLFAIVPEWVLYSEVSASAVRLYAVLARHADKDTGEAHPSRRRLATLMRCSASTIDRALLELKDAGAVEVTERYDDENNRRTTNLVRVLTSNPLVTGEEGEGGTSDEGASSPVKSHGTRVIGTRERPKGADSKITADQTYLMHRLNDRWMVPNGRRSGELTFAAIQKLNTVHGVVAVTQAMRELHGFPPEEAIRSPYAYLDSMLKSAVNE